jgi:hypothetical protein
MVCLSFTEVLNVKLCNLCFKFQMNVKFVSINRILIFFPIFRDSRQERREPKNLRSLKTQSEASFRFNDVLPEKKLFNNLLIIDSDLTIPCHKCSSFSLACLLLNKLFQICWVVAKNLIVISKFRNYYQNLLVKSL